MPLREWRNWQTRTFEGRVVLPYGFNSRFPHQKRGFPLGSPLFLRGQSTLVAIKVTRVLSGIEGSPVKSHSRNASLDFLAPFAPCFVDFVREKQLSTVFSLLTRFPHQKIPSGFFHSVFFCAGSAFEHARATRLVQKCFRVFCSAMKYKVGRANRGQKIA